MAMLTTVIARDAAVPFQRHIMYTSQTRMRHSQSAKCALEVFKFKCTGKCVITCAFMCGHLKSG